MKKAISTIVILLIIAFIWSNSYQAKSDSVQHVLYYEYTTPIDQVRLPSKSQEFGYLCTKTSLPYRIHGTRCHHLLYV